MTARLARMLRSHALAAGAIVAVAAAVRIWGLGFGLPHTQARPDETFVIDVALRFLSGRFSPDFYDYPTLYMFLLTGLYLVYCSAGMLVGRFGSVADFVASWPVDWVPFFLISRGLSAAFGTLSVLVTWRLAARLFGRPTGLMASAFLALAFLHVRDSHFGTTDVAMTFFVLSSLLFLVRAYQDGRSGDLAVAGALGGLAAATKYNGVLVAAAFLASLALQQRQHPAGRALSEPARRAALYFLPFGAAFFAAAPFVLLDLDRFREAMEVLRASMATGMTPGEIDNGWLYHLRMSLRHGLGLPLLAAGLGGFAWMALRDRYQAVLLAAFPLVYFAIAGASENVFVRYMLPVTPFLCISAAWGVVALAQTFRAHDSRALGNPYDRQDAFFLPYGRFDGVQQPGPTLLVYRLVAYEEPEAPGGLPVPILDEPGEGSGPAPD